MNLNTLYHTETSFSRLQEDQKALVCDLAEAIAQNQFYSPFACKEQLWKTMAKHRIMIPPDIFGNLEVDDSIEMWTSDQAFLFAMGNLLQHTSYSLEELTSTSWDLLFDRDELIKHRIIAHFIKALTTGESQFGIADWHPVREIRSRSQLSMMIKIKQITPFVGQNGLNGVIALVKVKPPILEIEN